jgi:hypothetical protein
MAGNYIGSCSRWRRVAHFLFGPIHSDDVSRALLLRLLRLLHLLHLLSGSWDFKTGKNDKGRHIGGSTLRSSHVRYDTLLISENALFGRV